MRKVHYQGVLPLVLLLGAGFLTQQAGAQGTAVNAEPAAYTSAELQGLVGPIALYPDDLVAIVLPASAYPLQVVEAARFLDARENDATLTPDTDWDDAVVALLNYPEVLRMMSEDLDWTADLGEAVVYQEPDVLDAIQTFRERARTAGNLRSDEHQVVSEDNGAIEIAPANPQVIYVPSYEPQSVVVYQREPVFGYYPYSYPLYYYPYPIGYAFSSPFYWGVTTAFIIGWHTHSVHVYGNNYFGHPYYGRSYYDPFYVRRTLSIDVTRNRYANNVWRPSERWGAGPRYRAERHYDGGYRSAYSGTQRVVQPARPPRVSNTLTPRDSASTRTRSYTAPGGNTTRRSVTAGSGPRISDRQPVNTFAPSRPVTGQSGTRPVNPERGNSATSSRIARAPSSNVYTRPAERTRPMQTPATSRPSTSARGLVNGGVQSGRTAIARVPAAPTVTQRQSPRATAAPATRFAPRAPAAANPPARTRSSGASGRSSTRASSGGGGRSNSSERSSGNRRR